MTNNAIPEIGERISTGAFYSNVHDVGQGFPVLLLHGSGPGVSAWANWRLLLDIFAFDRTRVTDELAQLRYQASIQSGFQESFAAMFPAPRQRWVDAMASPEADIRCRLRSPWRNGSNARRALPSWSRIFYPKRIR